MEFPRWFAVIINFSKSVGAVCNTRQSFGYLDGIELNMHCFDNENNQCCTTAKRGVHFANLGLRGDGYFYVRTGRARRGMGLEFR